MKVSEKENNKLRQLIKARFDFLQKKNPRFSLRSFAKQLDLSPTTLSEFLNEKRSLSERATRKIASNLSLNDFFDESPSHNKFKIISNDEAYLFSDWAYYAALSLMETKDFEHNEKWIAEKLSLTLNKTREVLGKLEEIGLITISKGKFSLTKAELVTTDDLSNLHLRKRHIDNTSRARKSLENDDLNVRDFTFMTLAIDFNDLKKYKKMVRKFQDELVKVQSKSKKNCVYEFSFQIFPVSK